MNVLSLFDGLSCGQIALNRVGIKYDQYFASEIKPHAIQVTQHNYPNTIQLGDVTKIKACDLPKIDLLIGGSPCQDLSNLNKERRGLDGESSILFFEFYRLWEELKPKYFFLENVFMDKTNLAIITNAMKVKPLRINSNLVSAQNRDRLYWTNIGILKNDLFGFAENVTPSPPDKKISLQSILTSGYTNKLKAVCLKTHEGFSLTNTSGVKRRYEKDFDNLVFLTPDLDFKKIRFLNQIEMERLQTVPEDYTKVLEDKVASRRHKKAHDLLGDGWTVDVVAHYFKHIK